MDQFIVLMFCFLLGVILKEKGKLKPDDAGALNRVIVNCALPALTFLSVTKLKFNSDLIYPLLSAWLVAGVSVIFFWYSCKPFKFDATTRVTLVLLAGFGSASMMGPPMTSSLFGADYVAYAVLIGIGSTCVAFPVLGVLLATQHSHGHILNDGKSKPVHPWQIGRSVFSMVPFLALLAGVAAVLCGWPWSFSDHISNVLTPLASMMGFLTFLNIGIQIRVNDLSGRWKPIAVGTAFKLVLAPLIIFGLYSVAGLSGSSLQITVFEMAMPSTVIAAVLAADHQLDAKLARSMVTVTTLLSLVSLPLLSVALKTYV
jgi:predicted permease